MARDEFESMLTGGHPNSLGRTPEVVELVLEDSSRIKDLLDCYGSDDPVVRLRTSNALKRVSRQEPEIVEPQIDRLLEQVSNLDQPSTQWTLAQVFREMRERMDPRQVKEAVRVMKRNLTNSGDWIVLTQTSETLAVFSSSDDSLREWLRPQLERLSGDPRKAVSKKASRLLDSL